MNPSFSEILLWMWCGGVGAAVGCLIAQHLIGSWREYRQERATRELEGHAVIRALRAQR